MANPQGMTDTEYIIHLEDANDALSTGINEIKDSCERMLVEKDRALLEKCKMCRGSIRV